MINHNPVNQKIKEIAEIAGYLWMKGWAEKNAGNISVNISSLLEEEARQGNMHRIVETGNTYKELAGNFFIVSGAGVRMRELARYPEKNVCIIMIADDGRVYQVLSDDHQQNKITTTSELPVHLAIQRMLCINSKDEKVVLHAHVDELIALTMIPEFQDEEKLNQLIWSMQPEAICFLPEGLAYTPYQLPGSEDIAEHTTANLKDRKLVLWQQHGCLAIGKSIMEAFDILDIAAKSASIFFRCRNAGYNPEGISTEQIDVLRKRAKEKED